MNSCKVSTKSDSTYGLWVWLNVSNMGSACLWLIKVKFKFSQLFAKFQLPMRSRTLWIYKIAQASPYETIMTLWRRMWSPVSIFAFIHSESEGLIYHNVILQIMRLHSNLFVNRASHLVFLHFEANFKDWDWLILRTKFPALTMAMMNICYCALTIVMGYSQGFLHSRHTNCSYKANIEDLQSIMKEWILPCFWWIWDRILGKKINFS